MRVYSGFALIFISVCLSGENFPSASATRLNGQVVEVPWTAIASNGECQEFDGIPSLTSVMAHCHGLRSWLHANPDNVAVVHCGDGISRTGIVVSCLLRLIGAFENSSLAFKFFRDTRWS